MTFSPAEALPAPPPHRKSRWRYGVFGALVVTILVVVVMAVVAWEMRRSILQAHFLAGWARDMGFEVQSGPSPANRYPVDGPFDERLGYTRLPAFVERLQQRSFSLAAQARQSPALANYIGRGFFAPYAEKPQAGLEVLDCRGESLFATRYPQHAYPSFEAIPPLVAQTLAFVENRELMQTADPKHNPAVEWDRLGRAVFDLAVSTLEPDHSAAGGSTLATQMEKYRHSPEGVTASVSDKYRQMVSASVRAYRDGEETLAARRRIVLDYVNSVPLGALRGYGEVNGILDGLHAWYGVDVKAANQALRQADGSKNLASQARIYRQMLSLLIAQRRPGYYFDESGQAQLANLTEGYLRLLAQAKIITPALRDAALRTPLVVREAHDTNDSASRVADRKAAARIRVELASLLETPRLYSLDRLDLRATSTIDGKLQIAVTDLLRRLRQPQEAQAAGLLGPHLLERGDPGRLTYSFTLYERGESANLLRVQTDNQDQPFDINTGAKLELGSTAKLRTLATYLEIVASLHAQLSPLGNDALANYEVTRKDRLTAWAVAYLSQSRDKRLSTMLDAAMARHYSASPAEGFFTGGGVHTFANYDDRDDAKSPTLSEGLRDSVNLVFIRLMRDLVHHHLYREPGSAASILEDDEHPERTVLLSRFADREGSQFMRDFYRKLRGQTAEQMLGVLTSSGRATPQRLAVIFRSVDAQAPFEAFSEFLKQKLPSSTLTPSALRALYDKHAPGRYSLSDRGYLARVHPLELWVAGELQRSPDASMTQLLSAGAKQRQEVYQWLFQTRFKDAQDSRILTLLEIDAFANIHRAWQRLGYPFAHLVPSYATAIGSSGDRPAALAELMGIIVNDGLRQPAAQIDDLHFATATPYETRLQRKPAGAAPRVMAPEVAATLRRALARVVDQGTAHRVRGAFDGPAGKTVVIGGKTGTGDNRLDSYGPNGALTGSKVINRTATFVFYIGERHFGTLTAYVPGPAAQDYRFTSALPVQILKTMAPLLRPLIEPAAGAGCAPRPAAIDTVASPAAALSSLQPGSAR